MKRRPVPARTGREQHRAWLQLVDTDGPFLAVPVLARVWPQGIPPIDGVAKAALVDAKPTFELAWDRWDGTRAEVSSATTFAPRRDDWVGTVLRDVLGWGDLWAPADRVIAMARVSSPDQSVTVGPTGALRHGDRVGAIVWVVEPIDSLRDLCDDAWASTPIDRMELMLRESGVPIGLVTDGRWWGLVSASTGTLAASGVFDALTWVEEEGPRNALVALLSPTRLFGGAESDRLPQLFKDSVLAAEEVTEALGVQVRKAVELVVQAFSDSAADARQRGDDDPLPDDGEVIYDAVVTMLMRVVFLLFAEERGLLPQGQLFEFGYGLAGQLDTLNERDQQEGSDSLDATHLTWHRLLATSQALYRGASFEDMRLPAYGGSLFDPDRFPFLAAVTARGTLALTVSDRVMLKVLDAVQTARVKGQDARRISFRDIDVEQIGYIYEGLLGYTCRRSDEVIVGLTGGDGAEPEIPLDTLNDIYETHGSDAATAEAVIAWAKDDQPGSRPPTKAGLTKAFAAGDSMEDAERALLAVTRDGALRDRLRPWVGAIRRDLRDRPVVIQPGGLVVTETPSRKNAGAHYTPRALAEEVVLHALEPLVYHPGPHQTADRDEWRLRSATELLGLKVADIACGSGAFLVAAARYLAARLVEAWRAEGLAVLPAHELETKAIREVVAKCLYGADINAMAVEMCKLSLWLVSLDRDLPFSFVDDKVLNGNSLLGVTSLRQLEFINISPPTKPLQSQMEFSGTNEIIERLDIDHRIQRAISLRLELASEIDERDPQRTAHAKRAQMAQLALVTADLGLVADGVIAAGLRLGGKSGRALDDAYAKLRLAVGRALPRHPETTDRTALDAIIDAGLTPTVETDYDRWKPLHWALEVPDVMERGGFDAIVGNPPFLGGKQTPGAVGWNIHTWYSEILADGDKGRADIVAYFFLRAQSLLRDHGAIGLIATNTIAQGDTRKVGLERMIARGFIIMRAVQSRPWPAATAALEYAAVWGGLGGIVNSVPRIIDTMRVPAISSLLESQDGTKGPPMRLTENARVAYQGCIVLGMGFVIERSEAELWIAEDSSNAAVLFPYLNGEDVNSRPDASASRWVIDFYDRSETEAARFHKPYERLRLRVKPERQKVNRSVLRERWWQYAEKRPGMRSAIANLESVLVLTLVSKHALPVRVPTSQVISNRLEVFATDSLGLLALLSSSIHGCWTLKYSTTLETRINYTPLEVFETFPQPNATNELGRLGLALDEERREMMLRRNLGLTKLYNLVNDPDLADASDADVARLRQIHVDLDHAVLAAYGWDDLPLDHGFHTYRRVTRWTISPAARVEILDRLLEENHRRTALQGPAPRLVDEADDTAGGED